MRKRYIIPVITISVIVLGATMFEFKFKSNNPLSEHSSIKQKVLLSKQFDGKKFQNIDDSQLLTNFWAVLKMYMFDKQKPASPVKPIDAYFRATRASNMRQGLIVFHQTLYE